MATEIKTWQLVNGSLVEVNASMVEEKKERKR